jgi:hypothetical protein
MSVEVKERDYAIKRPHMKTSKKAIVEWGMANIDECGYDIEIATKHHERKGGTGQPFEIMMETPYPVDASEMGTHCWRCGHKGPTERAHIIPWALTNYDPKYDTPSSYRLLCTACHEEAPNVADETVMDKWIVESSKVYNPHRFYDTYWYVREKMETVFEKATTHGFEKAINSATQKWILREMMKDLRFQVAFGYLDESALDEENKKELEKQMKKLPEVYRDDKEKLQEKLLIDVFNTEAQIKKMLG